MTDEEFTLQEPEIARGHSDDDDGLDGKLKIIEEHPKPRSRLIEISADEAEMLTDMGKDLEMNLEEKAAKTNLRDTEVKRILKQVVTNEHVLAYVRQSENPDENVPFEFEPTLTRAKAKELFPAQQPTWVSPKSAKLSKTQVLISGDLPEDESSGDEYIPVEEESEDDRDSNVPNEHEMSTSQPSTPQTPDCGAQTVWSEDGVFKIPEVQKETKNEKLNIALRTRSKLSLSNTPLEVIEKAFIPPDITTDMYDMDCDDDEWKNFLKEFTKPLDEIAVAHEDEDHDPEYNILADEEIDKVDKEELRADRGVKVTRKELNDLISELFDCTDDYNNAMEEVNPQSGSNEAQDDQLMSQENLEFVQNVEITILDVDYMTSISEEQKMLLGQQMRQYVQMATQHFLLTYNHPEYHEWSDVCYDALMELQEKANGNLFSHFCPLNLPLAMELIHDWKEKMKLEDYDVIDHNNHVKKVITETIQSYSSGTFYVPSFSNLFLYIVSRSPVFIYPGLLPRIAFKPSSSLRKHFFMPSELELFALGLEQFLPYLKTIPFHLKKDGTVKLKDVCHYVHKYMMPAKSQSKLMYQLRISKDSVDTNPVKYFFARNEVPKLIHYVHPLEVFQVVPPCERPYDQLPEQWKIYIYPNYTPPTAPVIPIAPKPPTMVACTPAPIYTIKKVNKPPVFNKSFTKKRKLTAKTLKSKENKNNRPAPKTNNPVVVNEQSLPVISTLVLPAISSTVPPVSSTPVPPDNSTQVPPDISTQVPPDNSTQVPPDISTPAPPDITTPAPSAISTPVTPAISIPAPKCMRSLDSHFKVIPKKITIPDKVLGIKFNSSIFGKLNPVEGSMFPSMPALSPAPKGDEEVVEVVEAEESTTNSSNPKADGLEENEDKGQNVEEAEQEKDNLDDINALMVASSTITSSVKKRQTCAEKKKAKQRREFKSNLRMVTEESEEAISEKADRFVQAYFDKIKERLEFDEYHKIMEIMTNFDTNSEDVSKLYKSVEEIIGDKHPDILEEFLCFFTGHQAKNLGKWMPYLIINKMSHFLRKLELFFNDQPSQVKKIYRCLTDLTMTKGVTMAAVKNTIIPLLKGNSLLVDLFLQIFPKEKPPDSLFTNGPWEHIEVGKDRTLNLEDCYESITIPEAEDPYGGANCICTCHSVDDASFKSRSMHCVQCGTKFMQGKLFVQTGKGLRIAKITFDDNSVDHFTRLSCPMKIKRADSSPTKQISPNQDEVKLSSDEEPDKKQQRLAKAAKKRKPKKKPPAATVESKPASPKPVAADAVTASVDRVEEVVVKKECFDQNNGNTSDSSMNEIKQATEENLEWDCNTSIESMELKLSPEHVSPESESEFCEETSQDNTDSDASGGESESNSPDTSCHWDRSEDKIILETFQRVEDKEMAFKCIAEILEHRTLPQIQQRFEMLINLLKKLSKNS